MIYNNVLSAVVSALAAEAIDNTSKQAWQKLYSPHNEGKVDLNMLSSSKRDGINRTDADCWVYARLHSQLIPRHWNALVAKFSTHKGKKVQAISELVPVVASHAPRLFLFKAITAWAIPPLKGVQTRSGNEIASRSARKDAEWQALDKAVRHNLANRGDSGEVEHVARDQYVKRSTDMIVLPAEFYDMNTWDSQGLNRTTYWRWKKGIDDTLEGMVRDALSESEKILRNEGVLVANAA